MAFLRAAGSARILRTKPPATALLRLIPGIASPFCIFRFRGRTGHCGALWASPSLLSPMHLRGESVGNSKVTLQNDLLRALEHTLWLDRAQGLVLTIGARSPWLRARIAHRRR